MADIRESYQQHRHQVLAAGQNLGVLAKFSGQINLTA